MKKILLLLLLPVLTLSGNLHAQKLDRLEYYIDADPGHGEGVSIAIDPGRSIDTTFDVDLGDAEKGFHVLYTRVRDANGQWSHAFAKPFYIYEFFIDEIADKPDIVQAEFYIDSDPGYGEGVPISIDSGETIDTSFTVDLADVEAGVHVLYTRVKDDDGQWSLAYAKPFYIYRMPEEITPPDIVAFEYFLTDGDQDTTPVTVDTFTPSHDIDTEIFVDLSNLVIGKTYTLVTIAVDENGKRSLPHEHLVRVSDTVVILTSPMGGEIWTGGAEHAITWQSVNVNTLRIEYSTGGGSGWTEISGSVDAYEGSFAWTVPDTPSENCLIKVTSTSNASLTSTSESAFTILPKPALTVTSPAGGEQWTSRTLHEITWNAVNVADVRIDYSADGGADWTVVSESADAVKGSYAWTVPETPSEQCLVRITSAIDEAVSDVSDEAFTILPPPSITVTAPNGGEVWVTGSEQRIEWTSVTVGGVKIEYSADNGETWTVVKTGTMASNGFFLWKVPDTLSESCLIRLTDTSDGSVADVSDGTFSIIEPQPYVTVLTPNGGNQWILGRQYPVTWESDKVGHVTIEYSHDGGETWIGIAQEIEAESGTYDWTVPETVSAQCRVRIADAANPDVADVSDAVFSIIPEPAEPTITLVFPAGDEKLTAGEDSVVRWESTDVDSVHISLSIDNGESWTIIGDRVPSPDSGEHFWTAPSDIESSTCFIRIEDAGDSSASSVNDKPFSIALPPGITLITPNGGEQWINGRQYPVTWESVNVDHVIIEYSHDGGGTWTMSHKKSELNRDPMTGRCLKRFRRSAVYVLPMQQIPMSPMSAMRRFP